MMTKIPRHEAEHWARGLSDMRSTLQHPEWLDKPGADRSFVTHVLHRTQAKVEAGQA